MHRYKIYSQQVKGFFVGGALNQILNNYKNTLKLFFTQIFVLVNLKCNFFTVIGIAFSKQIAPLLNIVENLDV